MDFPTQAQIEKRMTDLSISIQSHILSQLQQDTLHTTIPNPTALVEVLSRLNSMNEEIRSILERLVYVSKEKPEVDITKMRDYFVPILYSSCDAVDFDRLPSNHYLSRTRKFFTDYSITDGKQLLNNPKAIIHRITECCFAEYVRILIDNHSSNEALAIKIFEKTLPDILSNVNPFSIFYADTWEYIISKISEQKPELAARLLYVHAGQDDIKPFISRVFKSVYKQTIPIATKNGFSPLDFFKKLLNIKHEVANSKDVCDSVTFLISYITAKYSPPIYKDVYEQAMEHRTSPIAFPVICATSHKQKNRPNLKPLLEAASVFKTSHPRLTILGLRALLAPDTRIGSLDLRNLALSKLESSDRIYYENFCEFVTVPAEEEIGLFLFQLAANNYLGFAAKLIDTNIIFSSAYMEKHFPAVFTFVGLMEKHQKDVKVHPIEIESLKALLLQYSAKVLKNIGNLSQRETVPAYSWFNGKTDNVIISTRPCPIANKPFKRVSESRVWSGVFMYPDETTVSKEAVSHNFFGAKSSLIYALSVMATSNISPALITECQITRLIFHSSDHVCSLAAYTLKEIASLSSEHKDAVFESLSILPVKTRVEQISYLSVLEYIVKSGIPSEKVTKKIVSQLLVHLTSSSVGVHNLAVGLVYLLLDVIPDEGIYSREAFYQLSTIHSGNPKKETVNTFQNYSLLEVSNWTSLPLYSTFLSAFIKQLEISSDMAERIFKGLSLINRECKYEKSNAYALLLCLPINDDKWVETLKSAISSLSENQSLLCLSLSTVPTYRAGLLLSTLKSYSTLDLTLSYACRRFKENSEVYSHITDILTSILTRMSENTEQSSELTLIHTLSVAIAYLKTRPLISYPGFLHRPPFPEVSKDVIKMSDELFNISYRNLKSSEQLGQLSKKCFTQLCLTSKLPTSINIEESESFETLCKLSPGALVGILGRQYSYFLPVFIKKSLSSSIVFEAIVGQFDDTVINGQTISDFDKVTYTHIGALLAVGLLYISGDIEGYEHLAYRLIAHLSLLASRSISPKAEEFSYIKSQKVETFSFADAFGFCGEQVIYYALATPDLSSKPKFCALIEPFMQKVTLSLSHTNLMGDENFTMFTPIKFTKTVNATLSPDVPCTLAILNALTTLQNSKALLTLCIPTTTYTSSVPLARHICEKWPDLAVSLSKILRASFWFFSNIQSRSFDRYFDFDAFLRGNTKTFETPVIHSDVIDNQEKVVVFASDVLCPIISLSSPIQFSSIIAYSKSHSNIPKSMQDSLQTLNSDYITLMSETAKRELVMCLIEWATVCGELVIATAAASALLELPANFFDDIKEANMAIKALNTVVQVLSEAQRPKIKSTSMGDEPKPPVAKELVPYITRMISVIPMISPHPLPPAIGCALLQFMMFSQTLLRSIMDQAVQTSKEVSLLSEDDAVPGFPGFLRLYGGIDIAFSRFHAEDLVYAGFEAARTFYSKRLYRYILPGVTENEVEAAVSLFLAPYVKDNHTNIKEYVSKISKDTAETVVKCLTTVLTNSQKYTNLIYSICIELIRKFEKIESLLRIAHIAVRSKIESMDEPAVQFLEEFCRHHVLMALAPIPTNQPLPFDRINIDLPASQNLPMFPISVEYTSYEVISKLKSDIEEIRVQPFSDWGDDFYQAEVLEGEQLGEGKTAVLVIKEKATDIIREVRKVREMEPVLESVFVNDSMFLPDVKKILYA